MAPVIFDLAAWQAVLLCLLFATIYVGSLYIWTDDISRNRDHPNTIKRRFVSVAVISCIVPLLIWIFSKGTSDQKGHGLLDWLGIRFLGFLPALILPLVLTMVLFLGPLSLHYMDGVFRLYLEPRYWSSSLKSLIWIRNHIVAPFSEEFIFRACMLPLLVPSIGPGWSVVVCPLFFGVAHIHHMVEKVTHGQEVKSALKQSLFQMAYTTVFGAYSAFLFLRTGHLIAPVIAHAFCNHMGFPSFNEVVAYQDPVRRRLMICFMMGLILWLLLLYPMTSSYLFANNAYQLSS